MLSTLILLNSLLLLTEVTPTYPWYIYPPILIILTTAFIIKYLNSSAYVILDEQFAIDSISTILIILSLWITAIIFLARSKIINTKNISDNFGALILRICTLLILCFAVSNILIFYIIFEASLIPIIIIIILWGYQPERSQARIYLLMYTVAASLPLLSIILKLYHTSNHLNMSINMEFIFPISIRPLWLGWIILMMAFIVKLPIYSVHLWLPKAHVEAPVAGSIILAAVLLKLGRYGMLRSYIIFPHINKLIISPIIRLSLIGALITRIVCIRQTDLKSLIAYSSIGHMGLLLRGVITTSTWGLIGAIAIIIAHGISSSALFMIANLNYEIYNTRRIYLIKGIISIIPIISIWWFIFIACNMAAPPTINLLREVVLITSILYTSKITLILLAIVRFYSVAYSLYMYSSINHGHTNIISAPKVILKPKDMSLIVLHLYPIIRLIFKPSLITSWI